jgi:hypothetical protein
MFVIKRTDQGGGYLAMPGSEHSYTKSLENAQTFSTRDKADGHRCPGNEVVIPLSEIMQKPK